MFKNERTIYTTIISKNWKDNGRAGVVKGVRKISWKVYFLNAFSEPQDLILIVISLLIHTPFITSAHQLKENTSQDTKEKSTPNYKICQKSG